MSEKGKEDNVPPPEKRLSRSSQRNSLDAVVNPAGVTHGSPRTSSPSLTGDGNINDISDHPRDGDDISQKSVDIEEDDLQESNDIQEDFSRRPTRNFKL